MELFIAGGCGEHGRSCFFVQGQDSCFLVDCGKMADTPEDPYPRLTPEQIRRLDAVFLTHSHADHTGALPWLWENGFRGAVIASGETLRQLPFFVPEAVVLEQICPAGAGGFQTLSIRWGRSGHCAGSVWYRFSEGGKAILFSGDYTQAALVYACDPIWNQTADIAVLDCAYGNSRLCHEEACGHLVRRTEELLAERGLALFPVPKYGRGLELLKLFDRRLSGIDYRADGLFLKNLAELKQRGFWYRPTGLAAPVSLYSGQARGIVFVSDPQLRTEDARKTAEQVLRLGGRAVMTGTVEKGSYSEALLRQGVMEQLRYPVHLNFAQYRHLLEVNRFRTAIPYHSAEFPAPPVIRA